MMPAKTRKGPADTQSAKPPKQKADPSAKAKAAAKAKVQPSAKKRTSKNADQGSASKKART